ncbi:MAG: hypothetical protein J0H53_02085 [Rhizobiales bacterium]|nr:hypothetical protein [Hyphomicrobiales bacterium]
MVRTDLHGFIYGLVAIGLFMVMAAHNHWGVVVPADGRWDTIILYGLKGGGIYTVFFAIGHIALTFSGIRLLGAYMVLGSAAAMLTFWLLLAPDSMARIAGEGTVIATFAIPAVVGAIVGFAYHRRAGYDHETDSPDLLARVLNRGSAADEDVRSSVSADRAHVVVGNEEYFDGPLQVRTSFVTMLMAAFGAAFINVAIATAFPLLGALSRAGTRDPAAIVDQIVSISGFSAFMFLSFATTMVLPFAIMMYVAHQALRAMDKTSFLAYGVAGLVAPVAVSVLTLFMVPILGFYAALPSAIAMMLYRRLAGVEPKAVKEDVEVRDRRNLVGADHARRRYGRIIANDRK